MFAKSLNISITKYNWEGSRPILRYVLGISFVFLVTSLMGYPLAYLTTVLGLMYIAPGTRPITLEQGLLFIAILIVINIITFVFSAIFIDYPLVFIPLLFLGTLWIYFTDKFPIVIKLFAIISVFVIPLLALESIIISEFVAVALIFNAFMAIVLTQLVFKVFPWSEADEVFAKEKTVVKKTESERFKYALKTLLIIAPVLLLFFMFKLSGGLLILIFIGILSISPVLSNPKVGAALIAANILGGIFAILAYNLLAIVPLLPFMIFLTLLVGFLFGQKLFSNHKLAAIFGSGFSAFLLILGSVTSSQADAGEEVWTRVIQIASAVIYIVVAFGLVNHFEKSKKKKTV